MLKGKEQPLKDDEIVQAAGIVDKSEITLTELSWNEDDYVVIKVQPPNTTKIWTRRFSKNDSTRSITWQLAKDLRLKFKNLLIRRANGVALNISTTIGNLDLDLRKGEILKSDNIDGFQVNVNWMSTGKQQKTVWADSKWTVEQLHATISATLGLTFKYRMATENGYPSKDRDISHAHGGNEPLPKLDLYLQQPGQDNWDTAVDPTPAEYIISMATFDGGIMLKDNTGDLTVLDLLQAMHTQDKNLTARVVADQYRIRYDPSDQLINIACPDEPLIVHLADETYSVEELKSAVAIISVEQDTNLQDLFENKYTFINNI